MSIPQQSTRSTAPIRRPALIFGGVLWLVAFGALILLFYKMPEGALTSEVPPVEEQSESIWGNEPIRNFSLTDSTGSEVTRQDLAGKPFVVGFIFTRCAGPCPRVSGQMRLLQDKMKALKIDARLVTLTVDPDYDTPEILAQYAEIFGADSERWIFLTGQKSNVYQLITDDFLMPVQEMEGDERQPGFEVLHTTNLLLIDEDGVVRGKYNAVLPNEMEDLKRELATRAGS
ncbi:SCO family protein [Stratiformator vulcanicus]|uniref:Thioredoxin domain-containing protein n=1 Tax=Stratiformator vulcanicus TaxID=2527980 RepID=A0A517R3X5_9PLAN|nr:SCO family protein [Stratiformator vulcanicus]QDT38566.1 hypothetical protein Pan189_29610 [Stratiformator vulcanicus]